MNIINILKNIIFSKYFLSFFGLIIISYYIWFRFIRLRLPRDIPFDLSFLGLLFIISTCIIYCYILFRIIFPKPPSQLALQLFTYLNKIYLPLFAAHDLIINLTYIKAFYDKAFFNLIKIIKYFALNDDNNQYSIYLFIFIFPRILLLFVFIIDIFIFHTLAYFYKFIFYI